MKYKMYIKFHPGKDLYVGREMPHLVDFAPWWKGLEGEWEITEHSQIETHSDSKPNEAWFYSFVSLRKGISIPVAGCAIHNPHDNNTHDAGLNVAFKRAVSNINMSVILSEESKKEVLKKFRTARYNTLKQLREGK